MYLTILIYKHFNCFLFVLPTRRIAIHIFFVHISWQTSVRKRKTSGIITRNASSGYIIYVCISSIDAQQRLPTNVFELVIKFFTKMVHKNFFAPHSRQHLIFFLILVILTVYNSITF